ncbi:MAG: F0F1 ATP synthase subunit epsilon [Candidatus Liptonbacteria bacterium]|nr:F0F1 ATP synthase subunit epsilon [Candidatus Liptonbacteria bacterium]
MRVQIYSLKRTLFDGEAKAVNCQTRLGEITILDQHEPLVAILAAGTLHVTPTSGEDRYFPVKDGFLEVKPDNHARLIVEEEG